MMRLKISALFLLLASNEAVFAQHTGDSVSLNQDKPILNLGAFKDWTEINPLPGLSADGKYVYFYSQQFESERTLHIISLNDNRSLDIQNGKAAQFTSDSKYLILMKGKDSLCVLSLGNLIPRWIPEITTHRLFETGGRKMLAWLTKQQPSKLMLYSFDDNKEKQFVDVVDFEVNDSGSVFVYQRKDEEKGDSIYSICWFDIQTLKDKTIWSGQGAHNMILSQDGQKMAFMESGNRNGNFIRVYDSKLNKLLTPLADSDEKIDKSYILKELVKFSIDGSRLFFTSGLKEEPLKNTDEPSMFILSYSDPEINLHPSSQPNKPTMIQSVVFINTGRVIPLQPADEQTTLHRLSDDYVFLDATKGNYEEAGWSRASQFDGQLISSVTGSRKKVSFGRAMMSPNENYIVGSKDVAPFDMLCYDVKAERTIDLSQEVPAHAYIDPSSLKQVNALFFQGWLENENSILVSDRYDIWEIDLDQKTKPINLTNGFGRKHKIALTIARGVYEPYDRVFSKNERIVLSAFDQNSKKAGFFAMRINKTEDPQLLTMGPYLYKDWFTNRLSDGDSENKKYIVERCSATSSPNFYWTTDFNSFHQISNICPETKYNWLTSELLSFKTSTGETLKGILYKPENFSKTEKYPVVITYYETRTNELNQYKPLFSERSDDISIPWLVSHGYIVFVPDIQFKDYEPGRYALAAVEGARRRLIEYPWVDSNHIGLQGTSFGGYETNYVVTHSGLFAAAMSSSGVVDIVSEYGNTWGDGPSQQNYYENRQGKMGGMLWENPERYLVNSPIFQLPQVVTPMLIVANKHDINVDFKQGLGLFLGLRRLGKPAWLLQYDEGGHGLDGKLFVDLTVRTQQFFDYYLKGFPPPRWMADSVIGNKNGADGLKLMDPQAKVGPDLLTPAERAKQNSLPRIRSIEIKS